MDGLTISNLNSSSAMEDLKSGLTQRKESPQAGDSKSFATQLKDAIDVVDKLQKDADVKMENLATGRSQNLHETMIAAEKADLALRLMVQVRNKVVDAYQEVMKMQV